MTGKMTDLLVDRIADDFLPFVQRPARYIGGEVNQIRKDLAACDVRVALCFPDVYEVAMSHTGLAILYEALNRLDGVVAERVFAPWLDAEQVLRSKGIPLFSLESKASLSSFDLVGFTLTNELCYTNVLNMLDLAGMQVRSGQRRPTDPIVIGGGGMANCCEPIADFFDGFVLGDGEDAARDLVRWLQRAKSIGLAKDQVLLEAARQFDWFYVPSLYEVRHCGATGTLGSKGLDLAVRRENAVVQDFENAPVPTRPIVPYVEAIHERVSIEIMRGCPGRCRFCQVSFCKRPMRYRSVHRIVDLAKACYEATGFDTISLLSLSSSEYPQLEELVAQLHIAFQGRHVGLSVPSLRVDRQLKLLPSLMASVRKGGLTMAVEAASERLRAILNKPISDEDLFAAVEAAYRAGWHKLKVYFMVGLPGETEQDLRRIVDLTCDLARRKKAIDGRTAEINCTISWFVPKCHTPLASLAQQSRVYFEQARALILDRKRTLNARFLVFKFHDIDRSLLESALGRGDRKVSHVIEAAWRLGARFDLWDECFSFDMWQTAYRQAGLDLEAAAARSFALDEVWPWDHLGGPAKSYLLEHYRNAMSLMD